MCRLETDTTGRGRGRRRGARGCVFRLFISGQNHARNRAGRRAFCGAVKPYYTKIYEGQIIWILCDLRAIVADTGAMTLARFATGSGERLPEMLTARLTPLRLAHERIQRDLGRAFSGTGEAVCLAGGVCSRV